MRCDSFISDSGHNAYMYNGDIFYNIQWNTWLLDPDYIRALNVIGFIISICSYIHVLLIARIRNKLFFISMEEMNKSRQVICRIIIAWIVSCILGIPYGSGLYLNDNVDTWDIVSIIIQVLICLGTVVPVFVFVFKVQTLDERFHPRVQMINLLCRITVAICVLLIVSTVFYILYSLIFMLMRNLLLLTGMWTWPLTFLQYCIWIGHTLSSVRRVICPLFFSM